MTLLIDLPDRLEVRLNRAAKQSRRSPEQVVVDILTITLEDESTPSVSEIVAQIKAAPRNRAMIVSPEGSLADALCDGPTDADFDLDTWEQDWAAAEEKLNRCNRIAV